MVEVDWSLLTKSCRHVLGLLAWTWAITLFLVGYLGGDHEGQPPIYRQMVLPVFKVLLVAPAALNLAAAQTENVVGPGSAGHHGSVQSGAAAPPVFRLSELTRDSPRVAVTTSMEQDSSELEKSIKKMDMAPAKEQHLTIDQDGQYQFGYTAANSHRQERRHPDGSVQGSYSYTDPNGKLVTVDYTADATNGFNAVGENLPPKQVVYAPYPVQDTPEVAAARAQFLEYYQREFNHRRALELKENATRAAEAAALEAAAIVSSGENKPTVVAASVPQIPGVTQDDDTETIQAYDASEDSAPIGNVAVGNVRTQAPSNGQPSYNVQYQVGNGQSGHQLQQVAPASPYSSAVSGPGYFYYVGVGGLPHYVTSPLRANLPVSSRATQIGAIPAAAVHDSQTPHYGGNVLTRNRPFPPVYVELGRDYAEMGKAPGNTVQYQTMYSSGSNNNNNNYYNNNHNNRNKNVGTVAPVYPLYFPFVGVPVHNY